MHSPPEPEDEENSDEEENSSRPGDPQGAEAVELSLAAVRHQVDVLLEEWNKSADVLFSIHPMDGSLLVWHVDWLDEYQPGMFRQAQVRPQLTFLVSTGEKNNIFAGALSMYLIYNLNLIFKISTVITFIHYLSQ